jgi:hypothetical protein
MNIKDLSAEQKAELKAQLEQEEKEAKEQTKQEKEAYKGLQNEFVEGFFPKLMDIVQKLSDSKAELFANASPIFDLKKQVFGISGDEFAKQQSHSISNHDFSKTIILGHNTVDGWDMEVATAGIARVNDWLAKQASEQNQVLVGIIRDLLKPNKEGLLKAPRVLELHNQAEKFGDKELIEAVGMIKEAYRPKKTTTFIKAKTKDENGKDIWLNLSMSQA